MPNLPSASTALVYSSQRVNPDIVARFTGAACIQWKQNGKGWLYVVETTESKQYDEWKRALDAIESHIKSKCFLPILDDEGSTDGKIILNPSRKFQGTYVWKPTERPSKQHKVIHDSMPDKPSAVTAFAEKALEAVVKSHAQAIASKDETIRALTSALASRDEIIRVQAALISTLQG